MPKITKNTRKHHRIRGTFLLKYQTMNTGHSRITNLKDLSEGGLCFLTNENLQPGADIKIAFLLPTTERPLHATVRIVRVEQIKKGIMSFSVAVHFLEIRDEDQNLLNTFLRDLVKERKNFLFVDLPEFVLRKK